MSSLDTTIADSSHDITSDAEPDTGLQIEQEEQADNITDPFDPEEIKIRTVPILIEQLVSRIKHQEIDLTPEFQRLRGLWDNERKSRLIESLLLRIPIPLFYVAAKENDDWSVVDGLQRMSTIDDYVNGRFALERLQYLASFTGLKYDALPRTMQRRISETQLIVNVIEPGTPPQVMFNIFLRINTGGMTLNGQEIRHAMYSGPVRAFLRELADSNEFLRATDYSIRKLRMADRECVLRFLAFRIFAPEGYSASDLDSYLSSAMQAINSLSPDQRDALADDFKRAMIAAYGIFGNDAFRKRTSQNDNRRPVSRALFEVWSVHLARCSPSQLNTIVENRNEVRQRFVRLLTEDADFERAISYSTGVPARIRKRFSAIDQLLKDFN